MMKSIVSLALVSMSLATSVKLGTTNRNAVSNSTASCGVGYTYCGYILKSQKNYDDATILTAYCAGGFCGSGNGTTETDPMQALYVCVPETAIPMKMDGDDPSSTYDGPVKIEVLCACSGTPFGGQEDVCLDPETDHIGRCSTACHN